MNINQAATCARTPNYNYYQLQLPNYNVTGVHELHYSCQCHCVNCQSKSLSKHTLLMKILETADAKSNSTCCTLNT